MTLVYLMSRETLSVGSGTWERENEKNKKEEQQMNTGNLTELPPLLVYIQNCFRLYPGLSHHDHMSNALFRAQWAT